MRALAEILRDSHERPQPVCYGDPDHEGGQRAPSEGKRLRKVIRRARPCGLSFFKRRSAGAWACTPPFVSAASRGINRTPTGSNPRIRGMSFHLDFQRTCFTATTRPIRGKWNAR